MQVAVVGEVAGVAAAVAASRLVSGIRTCQVEVVAVLAVVAGIPRPPSTGQKRRVWGEVVQCLVQRSRPGCSLGGGDLQHTGVCVCVR